MQASAIISTLKGKTFFSFPQKSKDFILISWPENLKFIRDQNCIFQRELKIFSPIFDSKEESANQDSVKIVETKLQKLSETWNI